MSYKQFIPFIENEWDSYWKKTDIKSEIKLLETDGLKPIFHKYLNKKQKILEAGCGLGKWIIYLSKRGFNIQGVDNNRYAIKKLLEHFPNAQVKLDDVNELPFESEKFDVYLSLGVVEHFEEGPQRALKEGFRILKKGGIAIVEVPFDSPLRRIIRIWTTIIIKLKIPVKLFVEYCGLRKKRKPIKMKFYEYHYTTEELISFLKKAGFSDINIYPKDDLSPQMSIALWLDFPGLRKAKGKTFELNKIGEILKSFLGVVSPFSYCALIVAVGHKKSK